MRVRPGGFDEARLGRLLAREWGVSAQELRYAPVGYGSHHWVATTVRGERWFVTVDELGATTGGRQVERLRAALRSAVALRRAGLEFVVAPWHSADGEVLVVLDEVFAVAVLPFVDGRPWPGSGAVGPAGLTGAREQVRTVVTDLLARVHDATVAATPYAQHDDLVLEARADLQHALDGVHERWEAGPYSAGCRRLLAAAADDVRARLAAYDRLVAACRDRAAPLVLTHGEPKPDNFLDTTSGPALVDWDTALLAPAARDLWWLTVNDPTALDRYAAITGRVVHREDVALYALRWDLTDVALFVRQLRGSHRADADTAMAWCTLQRLLGPGPTS